MADASNFDIASIASFFSSSRSLPMQTTNQTTPFKNHQPYHILVKADKNLERLLAMLQYIIEKS